MSNKEEYIGYLEYSGSLVSEGLLDAKKAGEALIGFDEVIRYFINIDYPNLRNVSFEIPVRIKKGSWIAFIPAALGIIATGYLTGAAATVAKNDFKDVDSKLVFKKALESIQCLLKIAMHLGDITVKKIKDTRFRNDNLEIGIPNDKGEYLYVPVVFIEEYKKCPPKLFAKITKIIENERIMKIGVIEADKIKEIEITEKEKHIFSSDDIDYEIVFPELIHGQAIELEGLITKGNAETNSMGFKYKEHILNCHPSQGSIIDYKEALFRKCKIIGIIDRADITGNIAEKKPKIIFTGILPTDREEDKQLYFDKW